MDVYSSLTRREKTYMIEINYEKMVESANYVELNENITGMEEVR